jgi:hypothetical protein
MLNHKRSFFIALLVFFLVVPGFTRADESKGFKAEPEKQLHVSESQFWHDLFQGQKDIWTAPFHARSEDIIWIAPIAGATAFSLTRDSQWNQSYSPSNGTVQTSKDVSYIGSGPAVAAAAGGLYFLGRLTHDNQLRAAGWLGLEALLHTTIVTQATKLVTGRERPQSGDRDGSFLNNGNSFPSGHSAAAWALAGVFTEVYPHNPWMKIGAFSLATAVSVSRVTAQRHFVSDVIVGSSVGYLIGRMVVRQHMTGTKESKLQSIEPYMDRTNKRYGLNLSFRW